MTGMAIAMMGRGGVGVTLAGDYTAGTVTLNSNGTVSYGAPSGGDETANWYSPTTAGIGSSHWFRLTKTGGSMTFDPAPGSWLPLSSNTLIQVGGGIGSCTGTIEFATDSGGTNVVGLGTISVNNT